MIALGIWFVLGLFVVSRIDKDSFLLSNRLMAFITGSILMGPIAFVLLSLFLLCIGFAGVLNFIFS